MHSSSIQHELLIIDGMNIVRRCYEANPAPSSDDKAESACKAGLASIRRAIRECQPTHFLCVFDSPSKNWRHALFPEYKAHRQQATELYQQIPALMDTMNRAGLRSVMLDGVEADDVIATVALKAIARKFHVTVASTDKDLTVLIADGVRIRDHFNSTWRDAQWCRDKFGVDPRMVTDLLALLGDSVDGIPGVPSVGLKTAANLLINGRPNLDALIHAAESGEIAIKGIPALLRHKESALLSRKLAELKADVEFTVTPRELVVPSNELVSPHELKEHNTAVAQQRAPAKLRR